MKTRLTAAAFAAAFLAAPAAMADAEIEAACEAYIDENGGDASGCSCIADAASSDPALAEALAGVTGPADLEGLDPAVLEELAACFPNA